MFRIAGKHGLTGEVEQLWAFHEARSKTSHLYQEQVAKNVAMIASSFTVPCSSLIATLKNGLIYLTQRPVILQVNDRRSNLQAMPKTEVSAQPAGLALSPKQLKIVLGLFKDNLPSHQAWAFGSRVTGPARKYSDLDIAASHPQALPFHTLCQLGSVF